MFFSADVDDVDLDDDDDEVDGYHNCCEPGGEPGVTSPREYWDTPPSERDRADQEQERFRVDAESSSLPVRRCSMCGDWLVGDEELCVCRAAAAEAGDDAVSAMTASCEAL